jgi:hypothetical protein
MVITITIKDDDNVLQTKEFKLSPEEAQLVRSSSPDYFKELHDLLYDILD